MDSAVTVIPCFNEAQRLPVADVLRLAQETAGVVLVDDGSTDATAEVLRGLERQAPGQVRVLSLGRNQGKAEAVRQGLRLALQGGAALVGYLDADLSTPIEEALRIQAALQTPTIFVAMGARVPRAGAVIRRKTARRWLGRVFSTAAGWVLEAPLYDTQCGAKYFRACPALRDALETPFLSRWAFDVELLGRLLHGPEPLPLTAFEEVPLRLWRDVAGSKLRATHMLRAGVDLLFIRQRMPKGRP